MTKQDDGLFLLEVLIDKIVFVKSPCFSDKDFRTCVSVICTGLEPLEICDDEPGACVAKSGGPFVKTFNNGKSCLFSLTESEIAAAMSKFPVHISVYKALPCGCLPTKIVLGTATIDMTKEFVQTRNQFMQDPVHVTHQALKDSFRIVGAEGETGEIVMFLRISCFGKLIVTRFQGASGPPQLAPGGGAIVDRSCNPPRDFQTRQNPCVCGAARGTPGGGQPGQPCHTTGGAGVCPTARDPYNSMPCEDPDDPCYCSGPKQPPKTQMACRNTHQYCLHVPKGTLHRMPTCQDLTEEQKQDIKASWMKLEHLHFAGDLMNGFSSSNQSRSLVNTNESLRMQIDRLKLEMMSNEAKINSLTSLYMRSIKNKRSVSFSKTIDYVSESRSESLYSSMKEESIENGSLFGNRETAVYMTLYDDIFPRCSSGTQATASINKSFQVDCAKYINKRYGLNSIDSFSNNWSIMTTSTLPNQESKRNVAHTNFNPAVYFFGKKKNCPGMGKQAASTQAQHKRSTTCAQTCRIEGRKEACGKTVSIQERSPCPAVPAGGAPKGDLVATVSHIKIAPSEGCPVHGKEPCMGSSCILASAERDKAPVKVTTANNPRRGVFELVIRRMNGAPLARNELMLEWTPPPCRPTPCGSPCPVTCSALQCKMIVCRPTPCKPKCCRRICKRPCGLKPCGPRPCGPQPCSPRPCCAQPCSPRPCAPQPCSPRPCGSPPYRSVPCKKSCTPSCARPCRRSRPCSPSLRCSPCPPPRCRPCPPPLCRPCPPPRCRPCPPPRCRPCPKPRCRPCPPPRCRPCAAPPCKPSPPCILPYCNTTCITPCQSTPCLRPCPVGRGRRARKARSQPKIRSHRKMKSPCLNHSSACPMSRCISSPGPCGGCCLPPRSCSSGPCRPSKYFKNTCSKCC